MIEKSFIRLGNLEKINKRIRDTVTTRRESLDQILGEITSKRLLAASSGSVKFS